MGEDTDMNEKEKKELALSKIVVILLALLGLGAVVWLGWFAS
jgi:hypothetical protein